MSQEKQAINRLKKKNLGEGQQKCKATKQEKSRAESMDFLEKK